jgi:hypothetical protein
MSFESNNFVINRCTYCSQTKLSLNFPCSHSFCRDCYYSYYRSRIQSLTTIINNNPEVINGKCTCIGCPYFCDVSELTISPDTLKDIFISKNDIENGNTISTCSSFLSGIPTYFYRCTDCYVVHTSFENKFNCPTAVARRSYFQ